MDFTRYTMMFVLLLFIFHSSKKTSSAYAGNPLTLIHDLIQYNIAGAPAAHEKTEWQFDPELGKQRRVVYEMENGRRGEIAIEKLGLGIGYSGPWGTPVKSSI